MFSLWVIASMVLLRSHCHSEKFCKATMWKQQQFPPSPPPPGLSACLSTANTELSSCANYLATIWPANFCWALSPMNRRTTGQEGPEGPRACKSNRSVNVTVAPDTRHSWQPEEIASWFVIFMPPAPPPPLFTVSSSSSCRDRTGGRILPPSINLFLLNPFSPADRVWHYFKLHFSFFVVDSQEVLEVLQRKNFIFRTAPD